MIYDSSVHDGSVSVDGTISIMIQVVPSVARLGNGRPETHALFGVGTPSFGRTRRRPAAPLARRKSCQWSDLSSESESGDPGEGRNPCRGPSPPRNKNIVQLGKTYLETRTQNHDHLQTPPESLAG